MQRRSKRSMLRVIDIREGLDTSAYAIPGAEFVPLADVAGLAVASDEHVVLYSDSGTHAAQAWVLLRTRGVVDVKVLKDGMAAWEDEVLAPVIPSSGDDATREQAERARALSLWFGGRPRLADPGAGSPLRDTGERHLGRAGGSHGQGSATTEHVLGVHQMITPTNTACSDDAWFCDWRERELSRVERAGITYLDYTGAALYPESLVRGDGIRLQRAVLGNPHSEHLPSRAATGDVESARRAILDFLHADPGEFAVFLTGNASAGCKLVGESFPFGAASRFVLAADNHNSVNGVREYATSRGATVATIGLDDDLRLLDPLSSLDREGGSRSLLAFPAQSNFSGVRHPLDLIAMAQARGYRVLLDAAGYVSTADLRLDQVHPDYVALSICKIAGSPTGIGASVVRRDALAELRRPYFAGGTVQWVSVQHGRHRLAPGGKATRTVPSRF